jgi:hypothetical protein
MRRVLEQGEICGTAYKIVADEDDGVIVQIARENSEGELDWQDVCDDEKLAPY